MCVWGGGFGGGGGFGLWGQGGCELIIEVFLKIQKKLGRGGGVGSGGDQVGVRADLNEELKFLRKFYQKENSGGGGVVGACSGWGVRMNMN